MSENAGLLTSTQAWTRCLQRRTRLRGTVARYGLSDQADDIVHDVFVAVMGMPRLYPDGFDALLDTVLWRRCRMVATFEALQDKLRRKTVLHPGDAGDHADTVLEQVHAGWVLNHIGALSEPDIWMLHMMSLGYRRTDIATLSGRTVTDIDRAVRGIRRRTRDRAYARAGHSPG
ncbi:hypothetical protein [Actinokineospora sp. NBRC 105648]|uniref:hypothetical protein n=1 Tax=Actinokineospora sp. NBRC 105648 TaxID=3032206 RepID=UPI0024A344C7|nr:hypothetical protein [Actinokineospora sp. NBRC 105648]GLZ38203.1 hypothetical protein Acsp05_18270 [Actinokineospora sp. NBRC 105648]